MNSFEQDELSRYSVEREAWQVMGDRSLTITATVLGLSIIYLTSHATLTNTWILRSCWIVFSIGVFAGLSRLGADWWLAHLVRDPHRIKSDSDPAERWAVRSRGLQLLNFFSLFTGQMLLLTFGWINTQVTIYMEPSCAGANSGATMRFGNQTENSSLFGKGVDYEFNNWRWMTITDNQVANLEHFS